MSVFGFDGGPTYRGATRQEMFEAAMAQPMSVPSTLFDQAKGGILESFGLGTAIKDFTIPEGAPTTQSQLGSLFRLANPLTTGYEISRRTAQVFQEESPALSEDQYKTSPYFRYDIPWDARMTEDRAAALAMGVDARKVREFYAAKRPITAFLGNLAGQAVDPINYIPIAGPAVKAGQVARFGRIGGTAVAGALDAAGNTALFSIATRDRRASYGDDVSWQATVSEIATAALIGGAFGTIAGAWGRRADAKARKTIEDRLATLKTTQEARIALNEAIGGLSRGEDLNLSPNATEPLARVAREVDELSRAYDTVKAAPTGPVDDPLVRLMPEDIEPLVVARGAFREFNQVEFSKSGSGLVKVIWGHGERSSKATDMQVTKEDVVALPNIVREYEPVPQDAKRAMADSPMRTWRVERDGRVVIYGDKGFDGAQRLVTIHIDKPQGGGEALPLSEKRKPTAPPESQPPVLGRVADTAEGLSIGDPGAGQSMPATGNIARPIAIDNSAPRPEPIPEDRQPAETRIAKPDDYKAMSAQYGVDPEAGTFAEEADVARVRTEGRLTADDEADLADAQTAFEDGKAYGEALRSVVSCLLL